ICGQGESAPPPSVFLIRTFRAVVRFSLRDVTARPNLSDRHPGQASLSVPLKKGVVGNQLGRRRNRCGPPSIDETDTTEDRMHADTPLPTSPPTSPPLSMWERGGLVFFLLIVVLFGGIVELRA